MPAPADSQNVVQSTNASIIVLRGTGRALCSGGDVLAVVNGANAENRTDREGPVRFFAKEFALDHRISTLEHTPGTPKLYISVMDGIVMGGGVGVSVHAPFRLATEKTLFAMPETGIGYYPDVGVLHPLARLDGGVGMYLALTSARLSGEEAYLTGIATHYVRSSVLEDAMHRLAALPRDSAARAEAVDEALNEYASDAFSPDNERADQIRAKTPFLGARRVALDLAFEQPSVERIFAVLGELASGDVNTPAAQELAARRAQLGEEVRQWAAETRDMLHSKAPRSLKVTHTALQRARTQTLGEVLRSNMRLTSVFCDLALGRDFYTGVHHVLTKDPATGKRRTGRAEWNPASLDQVDEEQLRTLFFGDIAKARKAGFRMPVPQFEGLPAPPASREECRERAAMIRGFGPLHWQPMHNRFALPSEAEFAALQEGSHPAAGSYQLEPREFIDIIMRHKNNKPTLELKVLDWLERHPLAS